MATAVFLGKLWGLIVAWRVLSDAGDASRGECADEVAALIEGRDVPAAIRAMFELIVASTQALQALDSRACWPMTDAMCEAQQRLRDALTRVQA